MIKAAHKQKAYARLTVKAVLFAALSPLVLLILMGAAFGEFIHVSEISDRRIDISLSIFPRIVAVDNDFRGKLTPGSKARMVFVYDNDKAKAMELRKEFLGKIQSVAGMELEVIVMSAETIIASESTDVTALFLVERASHYQMYGLVQYAITHNRILFSPFTGDVERGATAGIAITSRVKPYFNMNTLDKSGIEINALLMKLSKRYE